jgi:hypothetical protein
MIRYRYAVSHGGQPVRTALLELWADDGFSAIERIRLLARACNHLRARDVHMVLALRCAMMPESAFAANLFLPFARLQIGALTTRLQTVPEPPRTWALYMM